MVVVVVGVGDRDSGTSYETCFCGEMVIVYVLNETVSVPGNMYIYVKLETLCRGEMHLCRKGMCCNMSIPFALAILAYIVRLHHHVLMFSFPPFLHLPPLLLAVLHIEPQVYIYHSCSCSSMFVDHERVIHCS